MNEQIEKQISDISKRINDVEDALLSIYRDLRLLERDERYEYRRVINARKFCFRLLQEFSEF